MGLTRARFKIHLCSNLLHLNVNLDLNGMIVDVIPSYVTTMKWLFLLFAGITWIPSSDLSAGPSQRTKKCYIMYLQPVWCCGDFLSLSVSAYRSSLMWWSWRWGTVASTYISVDKIKHHFCSCFLLHSVYSQQLEAALIIIPLSAECMSNTVLNKNAGITFPAVFSVLIEERHVFLCLNILIVLFLEYGDESMFYLLWHCVWEALDHQQHTIEDLTWDWQFIVFCGLQLLLLWPNMKS